MIGGPAVTDAARGEILGRRGAGDPESGGQLACSGPRARRDVPEPIEPRASSARVKIDGAAPRHHREKLARETRLPLRPHDGPAPWSASECVPRVRAFVCVCARARGVRVSECVRAYVRVRVRARARSRSHARLSLCCSTLQRSRPALPSSILSTCVRRSGCARHRAPEWGAARKMSGAQH